MAEGWCKFHRPFLSSPLWLSEPFTRGQAWVDLFALAGHGPSSIRVRGIKIELTRGQIGYSELTLSERWKWSRGKVRRFLRELKNDQMLNTRQDNKTTIITILNYDKYQGDDTDNDTANDTASGTPNGHQTDTIKNVKNEKKEEKRKGRNTSCAHPPKDGGFAPQVPVVVSPTVFDLPLNTGEMFAITEAKVAELCPLYPAVNVREEIGKMLGWLIGNPTHRKTRAGIMRFVTAWLAKAQDRGGTSPPPGQFKVQSPTAAMADLRGKMVKNLVEGRKEDGDRGVGSLGIGQGLRGIPAGAEEPGGVAVGLGPLGRRVG